MTKNHKGTALQRHLEGIVCCQKHLFFAKVEKGFSTLETGI